MNAISTIYQRVVSWFLERPPVLRFLVLALCLLVLLFILLGWQPWIPQVPRVFSCEVDPDSQAAAGVAKAQTESVQTAQQGEESATNFYFVKNEVVMFGPRQEVDEAVGVIGEEVGAELTAIRDCNLGFVRRLLRRGEVDPEQFPFSAGQQRRLVLRAYHIQANQPIAQPAQDQLVVDVVNAVNSQYADQQVYADPNYLTGVLGQNQCGSGHSPGGSPHSPGGSPFEAFMNGTDEDQGTSGTPGVGSSGHSPGGSPFAQVPDDAPEEMFWGQWALEHIGVGPSTQASTLSGSSLPTGRGVQVAVFDTSPFTPTQEVDFNTSGVIHQDPNSRFIAVTTASNQPEELELKVSYTDPKLLAALEPVTPTTNVVDHGLFVSGLVHAVAPESEIELIQVLNRRGCGDLQTLNESLMQFITQKHRERGSLKGTVISLSLGIHKPRSIDKSEPEQVIEASGDLDVNNLNILRADRLESLEGILYVAGQEGAVTVAASGNESTQDKALPMHVPADYPFVVGVSASNISRQRACFSNAGDVAAPGGDGAPDDKYPDRFPCTPQLSECSGDCEWGVISLALEPVQSTPITDLARPSVRYVYWSGTSFSTPLVSGLAALALDASHEAGGSYAAPDQIFAAIRCGALAPDGIISVPATLERCLP
jgi:hypothetical protein